MAPLAYNNIDDEEAGETSIVEVHSGQLDERVGHVLVEGSIASS